MYSFSEGVTKNENRACYYQGSPDSIPCLFKLLTGNIILWRAPLWQTGYCSDINSNISEFRNESFIPHNYHSPTMQSVM